MLTNQQRSRIRYVNENNDEKTKHELWGGLLILSENGSYEIEEGFTRPIRVARSFLTGSARFYRSADAVRKVEKRYYIITHIDSGHICLRTTKDHHLLGPALMVTRPGGGYHSIIEPEPGAEMIVHHALVPVHLVSPVLSRSDCLGVSVATGLGAAAASRDILFTLFNHGHEMSATNRHSLVGCLIALVEDCIVKKLDSEGCPILSSRRKIEDIGRYISEQAPFSGTSAKLVSEHFGISRRSLSKILAKNNTTFPRLLRDARISLAKELLARDVLEDYSISDICSIIGFASAPHFHKVFKSYTGFTPSDYRQEIHDPRMNLVRKSE